jgi:hypothetical protein
MPDQAKSEFEKVIKIDANHESARKELGYVKYNDKWLTKEEKEDIENKEKGLVKYGDKWMKKEEMEQARTKERAALGWDFELKLQTKHYLIYATTTEENAIAMGNIYESVYDTFTDYFSKYFKIPAMHPVLKIKLFNTRDEFRKICKITSWAEGMYLPQEGFCIQYFDVAAQNPYHWGLHEGVHQLCDEVLNVRFPTWLNEGIATYFSATKIRDNKLNLGEIDGNAYPVWWLKEFKDKLGGLKEFVVITPEQWSRAQNPNPQYLICWTLTHFLFHYHDCKYKDGFLKYIEKAKSGGVDLKTFESLVGNIDTITTEWIEYIKNIKTE